MTAERVDGAVAAIGRRNFELGRWADRTAEWLTAGEGEEQVTQASLQQFLWYYLPKKIPDDAWEGIAAGAAALFEELDVPRYATIARSPATKHILDGWRRSASEGFRRFKRAVDASGVEPPATSLIEWGDVMGVDEHSALSSVEVFLERAIVDGRLRAGARGWKLVQAKLCEEALQQPLDHIPTQTWLTLVRTERVKTWIDSARAERLASWREKAANAILSPSDPPEDSERIGEPLQWLLHSCRDGVSLTQSGYLPRALVLESVDRFGWHEIGPPPRSEVDVHQLGVLRDWAATHGWLRRRIRMLITTPTGKTLLADPKNTWRAIASNLPDRDGYAQFVAELVAHRLLEGPAHDRTLDGTIVEVVRESGWRVEGGPIPEHHIEWSISDALYRFRLFRLLDEKRPTWRDGISSGEYVTALTPAGRTTALQYLHAIATGPRRRF